MDSIVRALRISGGSICSKGGQRYLNVPVLEEMVEIKELGHVVLYVTNVERSAAFYREVLGFREIHRDGGAAAFSSGRTHHELLLIGIGRPSRKKTGIEPGLYHIGLKIGDSPQDIVRAYHELQQKKVPIIGTADHTVTHSIYIEDPDGNELELYADVSDEWKRKPMMVMAPTKELRLK